MTTNYYKINPPSGTAQEIDLPIDSIVYFAIKKEDFPNIWFPMLFLNETWQGQNKLTWYNYEDPMYPKVWTSHDMFITRFWTGYVPFENTFNAEIRGFTKVMDVDTPRSVTRTTYQTSDGDTFYIDSWTDSIIVPYWYVPGQTPMQGSTALLHIVSYIVRDSNLVQVGGYTRTTIKATVRQGSRLKNVIGPYLYRSAYKYGTLPVEPKGQSIDITGTVSEFDTAEATMVGESETVSIADGYSFETATPIIIPMHFSCTDKSYSYIYF